MGELYHVGMRFLAQLLDVLFPPRDTEAVLREATPETLRSLASPRRRIIRGQECITLLPYRTTLVRALILEAKFRRNTYAWQLLAGVLKDYLKDQGSAVLIPVPLGAKRLKEREYNQVAEVALRAEEGLETVTYAPYLLTRTKETLPQTEQSRSGRIKNMEDVFRATTSLDPDVTYLLLDDVATTGATLSSAARALSASGATRIQLVALAH